MIDPGQAEAQVVAVQLLVGIRVVPVIISFQLRARLEAAADHPEMLAQVCDALRVVALCSRVVPVLQRAAVFRNINFNARIPLRDRHDCVKKTRRIRREPLARRGIKRLDRP